MKSKLKLTTLVLALGLLLVTGAQAQVLPNPGFDMLGFIQAAT
jgi:hypothetical protein